MIGTIALASHMVLAQQQKSWGLQLEEDSLQIPLGTYDTYGWVEMDRHDSLRPETARALRLMREGRYDDGLRVAEREVAADPRRGAARKLRIDAHRAKGTLRAHIRALDQARRKTYIPGRTEMDPWEDLEIKVALVVDANDSRRRGQKALMDESRNHPMHHSDPSRMDPLDHRDVGWAVMVCALHHSFLALPQQRRSFSRTLGRYPTLTGLRLHYAWLLSESAQPLDPPGPATEPDLEGALRETRRVIAERPDWAWGHYFLAFYLPAGNRDAALASLRRALALAPKGSDVERFARQALAEAQRRGARGG